MKVEYVFRLFIEHLKQLIQEFNKHTVDNVLGLSDHPNMLPRSYDFYFAYGTNPASWEGEKYDNEI
ncbi:hypothetical protein SAMN05216378_1380 [Paenibacillus catalpae]|uniref:Uncharacterized protein n=1 Tax=Paenibacillus catalpae TaxID=1045775 RepID=A0A1I1V3Z6_9BACL|nr:hypothetical protein [Paenibacillus catalpae]SFD77624.1 hypothetical protein SAMN05216378_1380 [Paenibacillus catalpae]